MKSSKFILILLAAGLVGCIAHPRSTTKPPYYGETRSMYEVVDAINQNNKNIPTLWAEVASMKASWIDDKKKRHSESLDGGNLLYRFPQEVRLRGDKLVIGNVVEIGSNADQYWLVAKDPGPDTAWWGYYRHLGKECAQPIPIRPDLVLQVLGIGAIEPDFNKLPAPVMRFNHDADAYMFVWSTHLPDRWVALKEVWYDRKTLRPTMVLLFDANGRVVLRAWLSNHEPVESPNLPKEQWPVAASEYRLYFPESQSSMTVKLRNMQISRKGIPSEKTFRFDPAPAKLGVSKVIQLDENCGD
jgi:hypothetical protein